MRILMLGTLAVGALWACSVPDEAPDTALFEDGVVVITADTIYTGNPNSPEISGIAVDPEGIIVATFPLGSDAHPVTPSGPAAILSFSGTMFPGFVDGHAHLSGIGSRELTLDLSEVASLTELVTWLEAIASDKPEGEIIYGRGWIEAEWEEGRMPNAADLDASAPNNPVIYIRADGHALVANTAAMIAAGITDETPNPEGGVIERDVNGRATGIFIDKAMDLVRSLIDEPSDAEMSEALRIGADVYSSRGWTGMHNMSVTPREAPLMAALDAEGQLPLRLHNAYDPSGFDIAANRLHETDTIQNRAVKIYMDGALGSRGAHLLAPYSDQPETSGLSLISQGDLNDMVERAASSKVQLAMHAIGDQANQRLITMAEFMSPRVGGMTDLRWRIEHAQVLDTRDITKLGASGLIASMQPSHAIGDLHFAPDRLGPDRLAGAYAWRSLLDEGALIVGGSDAPVEVGSPLIEFYAAVARKDLSGFSNEDWHPEQAVSREEALAMFTSAPAFASFQEDVLGTIELGKYADLSVFDKDLMRVPAAEILDAKPLATLIAGQVVWEAE